MPTPKQAAIAAAVIAIWSAGPALAQSAATGDMSGPAPSDGKPGERASAVIRAIENEDSPIRGAVPVGATELARARAAGEMQTMERGEPIQVERLQLDEPIRSGPRASAQTTTRGAAAGRAAAGSVDRRQISRADSDSTDRKQTAAVVRLDDSARYRDQARYESAKRQRSAATTAATSERPAPALRGTQSKAEISWSAPERQDYRTAHEGEERTLY